MPSVTVKLIHTPRPSENAEVIRLGGTETLIYLDDENNVFPAFVALGMNMNPHYRPTPAEALALANALVLVAGCADTRWRGWHWEAREANGHLLAVTPPGEWYGDKRDAVQAVRTLFGYGVRVVLDYGDDSDELLSLREPEDANPTSCSDSSLLAFGAAMLSTTTPDADPDEYPVGQVQG